MARQRKPMPIMTNIERAFEQVPTASRLWLDIAIRHIRYFISVADAGKEPIEVAEAVNNALVNAAAINSNMARARESMPFWLNTGTKVELRGTAPATKAVVPTVYRFLERKTLFRVGLSAEAFA